MKKEKATFAGGCFWCMTPPYQNIPGVISVIPGYTGGKTKNPTYEQVSNGDTEHLEAIQVTYDSSKISYEEILKVFWQQIDPEDEDGQFADRGSQYKTAIFYHDLSQKKIAEQSKANLEHSGKFKKIVTKIKEAEIFYPAESYHCDYHKKNPLQYAAYKKFSGREEFIKTTWGK